MLLNNLDPAVAEQPEDLIVYGGRGKAARNHEALHNIIAALSVTAGLGGMGGAQTLSITMNEGVALIAEVEEWRIDKRIETRYLDVKYTDIEEAIDRALQAKAEGEALSIGVLCNAVILLE